MMNLAAPTVPLLAAAALLVFPVDTARNRLRIVGLIESGPVSSFRTVVSQRIGGNTRTVRSRWLATIASGSASAVLVGGLLGLLLGVILGLGTWWACRRWWSERPARCDPLALAAGCDLFALGARAGLPVPTVIKVAAAELTGSPAKALHEVADLLAFGADPVSAWRPALLEPDITEFARVARRAARTGSGLANAAADIAADARSELSHETQARAHQAAVWITAPLGLCFLPAFFCLGVLPVVVGMVDNMAGYWH